ncbi:SET domain-containing protein [Laetiporus sulphureus 93-53]|uniref:SET domain-containing protein n=1 Tax=Laetiporus sulphureus 93-53 TaxID=1314785 RepID=A0A165GL39_9APHY|nr:SET domain-containing protein [Laetiporus sulphureus 93-53]KZT10501.1 SET domain-containing protein [Laetiporus sulphureus 93-53]
MSFSNLHSARKAKEAKSFVKAPISTISDVREDEAAPSSSVDLAEDVEIRLASKPLEVVRLENTHRALPSSLEIRHSCETGRGMYAKSAFKAGCVLMATKPHVSVLSTSYLDAYCSFCCGPSPQSGLKRCTRCRVVHYCNSQCQNNDWSVHKHECDAIQKWAQAAPSSDAAIPGDGVRCLGRILWSQQKEGLDSAWTKEYNMMQSHRSSLQPSAFESHTHLAHSVVRYLGVSSPLELQPYGLTSAGDLVDLISRFTTNTFTLTSPSLTPIGISVCPTIAFANHSCDPNAVIVFPRTSSNPQMQEPLMHLVSIKPIIPDEEVITSYIDVTLPKHVRQKELQETYNFTCKCRLCTKALAVDPRESIWCPKSCGGTCPAPADEDPMSRCVKCKAIVSDTDTVIDAIRVGQEALDKATSLQFRDPVRAKHITTNMLPILISAHLTPSCHPLLPLTRLHKELLIASLSSSLTQDTLDETIRTARNYTVGLTAVLPHGHPVRGIALAELGKLLAVDEPAPPAELSVAKERFPPSGAPRLKLAYETLLRARDELMVGFGVGNGGGLVANEVREAIVRLEKELGAWTQGIKNVLEDANAGKANGQQQ